MSVTPELDVESKGDQRGQERRGRGQSRKLWEQAQEGGFFNTAQTWRAVSMFAISIIKVMVYAFIGSL